MADVQAIVPPHLTVRVICDQDHILSGLFIVFKLAPRTDGGAWDRVARVLEGTTDPGTAPADPSQPAEGAKPKKPSAKETQKYADARNKWQTQYNASHDLPPDPSDRFVAGFVDDDGYLVPVHDGSNPWLDSAVRRDPDAYKLGLGETYQACLLRHPDPELARAVARHLNASPSAGDAKYGIASWGTLLRSVTVEKKSTESGDQYVLKLSEDPSHFLPAGPARFGGWSLYLDMPHSMCASVPDQIEKLHVDLARFRYPTGEEYPFKFRGKGDKKLIEGYLVSRSLEERIRFAKAKAQDPDLKIDDADYMHEAVFRMQSQLVSAIGGFQEDLLARRAFALSNKAAAFEKGRSWAYVLGSSFTFAEGSTDPKAWRLPPYLYLGVVDAFTASMLEHWETHGLRKPGSVMVETQHTGYGLWMQERAAVAVDAWALLLQAFGVKYTASALHGGSSFRRLVDNPWPGSIKASLHNSGFAIDLAGGGRRHSIALWPIRYEADWVLKSERERTKLASSDPTVVDRGNLEHILMFKLYAHSELDVFGAGASAAFAKLRENIEAFAAENGTGRLRDSFAKLFKGLDEAEANAYLDRVLATAVRHARALLGKTNDELKAAFFRDRVHQFLVNPYEADAGTSMPAHGPREGGGDFVSVDWANSWVNVTALGYELGMERIGAHQNDVRDQTFLWGDKHKNTVPVSLSMLAYMREPDPDSDLVSLVHDMTAPASEAPDNVHYTRAIPLRAKANRSAAVLMEVQPADIDRDFFTTWRDKLRTLPKSFQPGQKASKEPSAATGAQLRVVLSAVPGKDAEVEKAADVLAGFGSRRFVVMHAGSLAAARTPASTLMTGSQLSLGIKGALADFQAIVAARWKTEDDAAAAAQPTPDPSAPKPELSRDQLRRRKAAEEAKAKAKQKARDKEVTGAAPDWTIVIQPVFVTGAVDPKSVPFLPSHFATVPRSSAPGHLEWWHYQHRQTGKNWGEAVSECGYSHTILGSPRAGLPEAAPVIHRGAGFDGELDNRVGSMNWGQPGNTFAPPSGG